MTSFLTALERPRNFLLLILVFALMGVLLVYDVSVAESLTTFGHPFHFARRQLMWVGLGTGILFSTFFVPTEWWRRWAPAIFLGSIILLIAVLIPGVGTRTLGAQRRIDIGPVNIQPAEVVKLALILFFSSWLVKHQRFAPFVFFTGMVFGLILLQPNLSTASIIVFLATLLYFIAGGNWKPLVGFGSIGALILALLILAAPYRRERLLTLFNPASDPLGSSYHIRQITIALGRGGWWGQGIGLSKQKQQYIPETGTDSLFAIYAEETGFFGSILLLGAYGILLRTGYAIARKQKDRFAFLVATGITSWIGLHTVLNVAAMVALVPLTGIPLPLISYGGSSFLSLMAGLGILARLAVPTSPAAPVRRLVPRRSNA